MTWYSLILNCIQVVISAFVHPWDSYKPAANVVSNTDMGKALLGVIVNPAAKGQSMTVGAQNLEKLASEGKVQRNDKFQILIMPIITRRSESLTLQCNTVVLLFHQCRIMIIILAPGIIIIIVTYRACMIKMNLSQDSSVSKTWPCNSFCCAGCYCSLHCIAMNFHLEKIKYSPFYPSSYGQNLFLMKFYPMLVIR